MRLDVYLAASGLARSRSAAKQLISFGAVTVDGKPVNKPSLEIDPDVNTVEAVAPRFVSRGGIKLQAAIDFFNIDVVGKKCIDVGASTGGFTDCLLQNGAGSVLCVDCGHGQLDPAISADKRVTSMEGFNARDLSPEIDSGFEVCVADVSFISQTLLHCPIASVLSDGAVFISLIKPQFEAGKEALNAKGIVTSEKHRKAAVENVVANAVSSGFVPVGVIDSPIDGGDGNREYLAYFKFRKGKD